MSVGGKRSVAVRELNAVAIKVVLQIGGSARCQRNPRLSATCVGSADGGGRVISSTRGHTWEITERHARQFNIAARVTGK